MSIEIKSEQEKELLESLTAWKLKLTACTFQNDSDMRVMEQFLEFVRECGDFPDYADILRTPQFSYFQSFFKGRYLDYIDRLEQTETELLLGTKVAKLGSFTDVFRGAFGQQAYARTMEIFELVDFSSCDTFVMVGCGPLPVSVLAVHDRTETREIIGLDIRAEAIATANRIISDFALSRIRLIAQDAITFDYAVADIIYVANMVSPKRSVLKSIAEKAKSGTIVVVREPILEGQLLAESAENYSDPRFCTLTRGEDHRRFLSKHVTLRKN